MKDLKQQLLNAGIKKENIDYYESDLYVIKNDISTKIINNYKFKDNVTTFKNDDQTWYDIPFAYNN